MTKFCLVVDFRPGVSEAPVEDWDPEEIAAHLDYYRALNRELVASGEQVSSEVLAAERLREPPTWPSKAPCRPRRPGSGLVVRSVEDMRGSRRSLGYWRARKSRASGAR